MDIDAIRKELTEQRELLAERVSRIAKYTRHRDEPLPPDLNEQAQELENEELLVALDTSTAEQLKAVEKALARIERNEYGLCVHCGESIDNGRLEAYPTAERCITCES